MSVNLRYQLNYCEGYGVLAYTTFQ
ncbi:hypothetical protein CBM2587_A160024 [Cupriavidus taiwanensis]|uniref:Uncharacterized protein n=1 Tax=Cupriavidus taiwanensis TaxID=164546 RepID=A0A375BIG1_9BURK|nr:hypothetical protein CBM2587_A160024 [Cupriavidus taiwanensis]